MMQHIDDEAGDKLRAGGGSSRASALRVSPAPAPRKQDPEPGHGKH